MRLGLRGCVAYNAAVTAAPARPRLLAIVNTAAGAGRTGRRWPDLARELGRCGLAYDSAFTREAGDAARLARQAAVEGYAAVVAVGGDGTINEVLNGLMAAAAAGYPPPALGVLPSGTAQDFARSVGIPPQARLDDGLLDLIVVSDAGRLELLLHLPLAISGRHLRHPKVTALRARSVDVAAGEPLPVQSDGEVVGTLPARFDVLPGALRLLQA